MTITYSGTQYKIKRQSGRYTFLLSVKTNRLECVKTSKIKNLIKN